MNTLISKLRNMGFDVSINNGRCVLRRYIGSDREVTIPDEVDIIGSNSFFSKPVESVSFGSNIKVIESSAFEKCSELKYISPLYSVEEIGAYSFSYTIKLQHIKLGNNLRHIGECAFNGSGIESVVIPNSVEYVDFKAFFACHKLKDVTVDGVKSIVGESAFANCRNMQTLSISGGVDTLSRRAFSYCKNLRDVRLSKNTKLGEDVFEAVESDVIKFTD